MNRQNKIGPWMLTVPVLAVALGCTTFGHKEKPVSVDSLAAAAQGETLVHQTGRSNPVLSMYDREHWVEIRSHAQSDMARLHATLATGEVGPAESLAREYLRNHPGNLDALTVLSASLAMQKKYRLANYYAGLILKKSPAHPVALNIAGLAAMLSPQGRMADYVKAKRLFRRAFEGHGDQIAPGLNLGHLQLELGDAASAVATFSEVRARCEDCVSALIGFGIATSRIGKAKVAVEAFETVLAQKENDPRALFHLALVHKNGLGNIEKAESYLVRLLRRSDAKEIALRERAGVVLRQLKGRAAPSERTYIADQKSGSEDRTSEAGAPAMDAELLMTTLEGE